MGLCGTKHFQLFREQAEHTKQLGSGESSAAARAPGPEGRSINLFHQYFWHYSVHGITSAWSVPIHRSLGDTRCSPCRNQVLVHETFWAMQPLRAVLEVTVFHSRKHLSPRTSIFLFLAFILLLCSCTGISKIPFIQVKKYSQIYSVFTGFSELKSEPSKSR